MSETFKERHWEKSTSSEEYTTVLKIFISCWQRHKSVTWYFTITASLQPGTGKQTQAKCSGLPFEIPWVQAKPGAAAHYSVQTPSSENTDFADSPAQSISSPLFAQAQRLQSTSPAKFDPPSKKSETCIDSSLSHLVFSWDKLRTIDLCWDCAMKISL